MLLRQFAVFAAALALAVGLAWASQAGHKEGHFKGILEAASSPPSATIE